MLPLDLFKTHALLLFHFILTLLSVTIVKVRKLDAGIARRSTTPEKISIFRETVATLKIYFRSSLHIESLDAYQITNHREGGREAFTITYNNLLSSILCGCVF